jgi:probable HAF family extracellular repeat protein
VFAHAINNNGQIAGFRYVNMSTPQALILENGQIRELAPFGSAAYDINDRGEAVGYSNQQGASNAFRWHNGVATNLGVLRGRNLGRAYSINNQGLIVGASGGAGGDFTMSSPRAFLWRDGRMTDLNGLTTDDMWVLEEARAINDRGQIVGTGRNRTTGAAGAILLNPGQ